MKNSEHPIRIGLVGAGENTRQMHIPKFQAIDGVEIVSVANRTRESGERVAKEFGIPKVYDNWAELIDADDTDAICIGTWPYMHCMLTLNALDCNKHVLCEARMAMNVHEARGMLDTARRWPTLVTQLVPAPMTLEVDDVIRELIADGYLGKLTAVEVRHSGRQFIDTESPLTWRQDADLSGFNTLALGIFYETLMRWVGPATRVMAMTKVNVPRRKDADGLMRSVTVPDHVDVLYELVCGAPTNLRLSAVTGLGPKNEAWLFGTDGTLTLDFDTLKLRGGKRGDTDLKEIPIPAEKRGGWRVEEEFIGAIRGEERVRHTTFDDGLRYMEFTEAVIRSAQSGQAVSLPF